MQPTVKAMDTGTEMLQVFIFYRLNFRIFLQPPEHTGQHDCGSDDQDQFCCRLDAGQTIQGTNSVPDKQRRDLQHRFSQGIEGQGLPAHATGLDTPTAKKSIHKKRLSKAQTSEKAAAVCHDCLILHKQPNHMPSTEELAYLYIGLGLYPQYPLS